jgi:serine protease AprX
LLAPSSAIAAANPSGWQPNGLFRGSGTSEATAVTSGVVAAYLSQHPRATPAQVKAAVRADAAPLRDRRSGAGLLAMTHSVVPKATPARTGEAGFNAAAWKSNAWSGLPGWQSQLNKMWSGPAWSAVTWSAVTWSAVSWSSSQWSAVSWSAVSWSAVSWSAVSWSAVTWSAVTWSAVTWSAVSWSDYGWGNS